MDMHLSMFTAAVILLLLSAFAAANLPFFTEKFFGIFPPPFAHNSIKTLPHRWFELVVWYFLVGLFGRLLEQQRGQIYPQGWEFYAITFCMFVVLAYPGFVWRYLRRQAR